MNPSPYRTAAEEPGDFVRPDSDRGLELLPFFALLWLASIARVVAVLALGESFGSEATLALLAVVLLPWLARQELAAAASAICTR